VTNIQANVLFSLGLAKLSYFERFGELADAEASNVALQQAAELPANKHPKKAVYLDIEVSVIALQLAIGLETDEYRNMATYSVSPY
jgi:hypothetical protein